ncbi:MAG: AraC family transcriptional regulator [Gammaproteobacteria bacterium]|nr:AraC family transcriptional regulator [Gammaproteobacteria bacterium]
MPTISGNAFSNSLSLLCHQLRLSWSEIASQLSAGQVRSDPDTQQQYAMWTAVEHRYDGDDFALRAADIFASTPSHPAQLACLCSPNLEVALERLRGVFPSTGLVLSQSESQTTLTIDPDVARAMPVSLQLAMLAYVVSATRQVTRKVVPLAKLELPADIPGRDAAQTYFAIAAETGPMGITFGTQALQSAFHTADTEIWSAFEMRLNRSVTESASPAHPYAEQVQEVLYALLPTGCSTIEHVSDRLAVSKRTLQRKLSAEGQTFQKLLHKTRKQLAHYYLSIGELSVAEIAGVLSYRDPHSFLRAYRGWTGKSPARAETA